MRLRQRFGDRHFVHRSVRYNLSTFLESGALTEGSKPGIYVRGRVMKPRNVRELSWLVEALLHAQDQTNLSLQQIIVHGALFPFDLTGLALGDMKSNPHLEVFRHGLTESTVVFKRLIYLFGGRKPKEEFGMRLRRFNRKKRETGEVHNVHTGSYS